MPAAVLSQLACWRLRFAKLGSASALAWVPEATPNPRLSAELGSVKDSVRGKLFVLAW